MTETSAPIPEQSIRRAFGAVTAGILMFSMGHFTRSVIYEKNSEPVPNSSVALDCQAPSRKDNLVFCPAGPAVYAEILADAREARAHNEVVDAYTRLAGLGAGFLAAGAMVTLTNMKVKS